ncbi:MAG: cardiolipin synthase B [Hydrogenophilales bacterium 28-61-23]|nr:MAG: cardiolipin synthase B [Hydrogenophilales bacterium 28-61-23]
MIKSGNRLTLLENGAEYFPALIAALDAARREIHLESYIFVADRVGLAVAEALIRAARRGVETRLLLDGFGSRGLGADVLKALRAAGVAVLFFRPERGILRLHRSRLRRMHRKLAVIDARIGFVGGINLIDDLHGRNLTAPRQDYAVRIEGPLIANMHAAARRLWQMVAWSQLGLRRSEDAWLKADAASAGNQRASFLTRDSVAQRRTIEKSYLRAIRRARSHILIANAYFLPGLRFRHALIDAAQRGVRVTLIVQGNSDHPLYLLAARALYRHFLDNGIVLFEYHASELHAKVAVIDDAWATVGSSNIDPFSLMLSREANLVAHDHAFAQQLRANLELALQRGAHQIHHHAWRQIPWYSRLTTWLAYGLVRLFMGIGGYAQAYDGIGTFRPRRKTGKNRTVPPSR